MSLFPRRPALSATTTMLHTQDPLPQRRNCREPTSNTDRRGGVHSNMKGLLLLEEAYPTKYWLGSLPLLGASPIDFTFATLHGRRELHDAAEGLGMKTVWLDCRSSLDYPLAVARLTRLMRRERFGILHLNESIQAALGGIASQLSSTGIRIFHRHHLRIEGSHRLYSWLATKSSHVTMGVSHAVARQAMSEGADPLSVKVAHNGVPEPRDVSAMEIAAIKRELDIPMHHLVVLTLGVLRPEKGQGDLLRAIPHLREHHASFTAVVVGSEPHRVRDPKAAPGQYASELRSLAARIGGSVRFVDHQADTAPWFAAADVVVVPSHTETFGLVAAEAMAAAKPVVSSDAAGLREIVEHGVTGSVVGVGEPRSLAASVAAMLQSSHLRAQYGAEGRSRYLERFTLQAMVARWIEVYSEATRSINR